jgi:hypothetical protein
MGVRPAEGADAATSEVSGFIIAKNCINNQPYATTLCRARKTSCPLRQLIRQTANLGDSFVAHL